MSDREIEHDDRATRARELYDQRRFEEALVELDGAPQSPEVLRAEIEVLRALGETAKAIERFQRLGELLPDDPSPWLGMAHLLTGQSRYDEALAAYQRLIDRGFQSAALHRGRALALRLSGDINGAVEAYDTALETSPTDSITLTAKADLLIELSRFPEALEYLARAEIAGGLDANGWASRGFSLTNVGALDEALQCYDRALAHDSRQIEALLGRATALQRRGDIDGALAAYDRLSEIWPQDATGWAHKGDLLSTRGKLKEAFESYEKALERDPRDKASWLNRGYCWVDLGEPDRGLRDFARAMAIDPDYAYAWEGQGYGLDALARHAEAVSAYRRALALDSELLWANNNLGFLLASTFGRNEEALGYYDKALSIRPYEVTPLMNKADALLALERHPEALELLKDAVTRVNESGKGAVLRKLAMVFADYGGEEEKETALDCFERAEREGFGGEGTDLSIAELLLRLDRHDEARGRITKVLETTNEIDARVTASFLLFASCTLTGKLDEALEKFAQFLHQVAAAIERNDSTSVTWDWSYKGFLGSIAAKELDLATKFLLLVAIDLQSGHLTAPSLARLGPPLPLAKPPERAPFPPLPQEEENRVSSSCS